MFKNQLAKNLIVVIFWYREWVSQFLFQYLLDMFIRKKKNPSGVVSVQIIDKSSGKYKMVKTIGSSSNPIKIARFFREGEEWIKSRIGQTEIDFSNEIQITRQILDNIEQIKVQGTEMLLGDLWWNWI